MEFEGRNVFYHCWTALQCLISIIYNNLLLYFSDIIEYRFVLFLPINITRCQKGWRLVVSAAVKLGIPTPAFSSALAFYDGYRTEMLPANLLQAQRDYFGAHTYELLSKPGEFVHTQWFAK